MSAISSIKDSLGVILGDNHSRYISSLRDWFSHKTSKDDFDLDVLPFLHGEALILHNQFMFVILNECQTRTSLSPKSYNSNTINTSVKRITQHKKCKSSAAIKRNDIEKQKLLEILKKVRPPEPKDSRFPDGFMRRFLRAHDRSRSLHPNIILNVTHVPTILTKHLARDPKMSKFFTPRKGPDQPFLTCNPSVQGKLLLKAWSKGITTIELDAVDLVVKSCHAQIKKILTSLLKRRRALILQAEARDAMGETFPNPQLIRGSYIEDIEAKPEPEQVGGFIRISPSEDRDRITALEASCSIPIKSSKIKTKTGAADLFEVIQADSSLIPCSKSRHLWKEKLFLLSNGYTGSLVQKHTSIDMDSGHDINENEDEQDLLPICSY